MDNKTRGILLKARKKADAGFGASHWAAVLRALGFQYEVAKRDRQRVLEVRITAPNGAVLVVEKDPRYKAIGFGHIHLPAEGHAQCDRVDPEWGGRIRCTCGATEWPCCRTPSTSLTRWAAEQGYPIHDLAARALGVPTVDEERGYMEYKARDWTHTGTCGVCGQNVKMEALGRSTSLVLHGYRRPGDGEAHGECFGRGYPPHELAPDAARDFLAKVLIPSKVRKRFRLEALKEGKVEWLTIDPGNPRTGRPPKQVTKDEPSWAYHLGNAIRSQEDAVQMAERYVEEFTAKVDGWKLDELPEIKNARRFAKQPARNGEER